MVVSQLAALSMNLKWLSTEYVPSIAIHDVVCCAPRMFRYLLTLPPPGTPLQLLTYSKCYPDRAGGCCLDPRSAISYPQRLSIALPHQSLSTWLDLFSIRVAATNISNR